MESRDRARNPLLRNLSAHLSSDFPLTEHESAFVRRLHSATRAIRRGDGIIAQGHTYNSVFVLVDGIGMRYKVLADGQRQVFHVVLPGDLVGYPACFFNHALYSVTALTRVSVYPLTFADMTEVFNSYPRLAMSLFWSGACEIATLGEHLTAIGRRSAYERVAHFILEMSIRLHDVGIGDGTTFTMPLTQEQIADVLGLTSQHINRMLRRLREDEMIEIDGTQIRLLDLESLAKLADFNNSYLMRRVEPDGAMNLPSSSATRTDGAPIAPPAL